MRFGNKNKSFGTFILYFSQLTNELVGNYYDAEQFVNYKANSEQPLPMIYQSGYLTIKDYDKRHNSYLLDFPNEEVRTGFVSALATGYFRESNSPKSWLMETIV